MSVQCVYWSITESLFMLIKLAWCDVNHKKICKSKTTISESFHGIQNSFVESHLRLCRHIWVNDEDSTERIFLTSDLSIPA